MEDSAADSDRSGMPLFDPSRARAVRRDTAECMAVAYGYEYPDVIRSLHLHVRSSLEIWEAPVCFGRHCCISAFDGICARSAVWAWIGCTVRTEAYRWHRIAYGNRGYGLPQTASW